MAWVAPTHDSARAQLQRLLHPGWGCCGRCGLPWAVVALHNTDYNKASGCFILCEDCWSLLGCPEARIEYYAALIQYWEATGSEVTDDTKREIQRAVANGG